MSKPLETAARIYGLKCMARLHQTMLPLLMSAGVRRVEKSIGRPLRFFQRARQQDALRVSDYFATCAQLHLDPAELLTKALGDEVAPEIRRPRIVSAAWKRIDAPGKGLGARRLQELESSQRLDRQEVRTLLKQELDQASQNELPLVLGLYASALRFEGDLSRAALVFREAIEMAKALDALPAEAHLLIRMAYLALEWQSPAVALRHAQEGTLAYACLGELEGQARGFLAMGSFRYYTQDYRRSLQYHQAALARSKVPSLLFSAHLNSATCCLHLEQEERARYYADEARKLAEQVDPSIRAKLLWFEARISGGSTRFEYLKAAQADLAASRPADCLLVTLDLIEEYLSYDCLDEAAEEIPRLCDLVEYAAESRQVQQAVSRLVRHHSRLTPKLTDSLRRALDQARDRRLSNLISEEL